jgi:hypothetical protein
MSKRLPIALLVVFSLVASNAYATSFVFPNFSDVSALQLNGDAAQAGNALRLTPATSGQSGTAFMTNAITLNAAYSFSTFFSFLITTSGGISDGDGIGADGLTFIVQTNDNTAGSAGGGLGYQGILNSMAVEFDTYDNGLSVDPNGNHVGIDLGGNIASVQTANVATRMNNGQIWYAWVDYDGSTDLLEVRLNQVLSRPLLALVSHTFDLGAVLGVNTAFVGFGSGTGAAWGNHDILSWEFRDEFNPVDPIPEPATLLLLGSGLAVAARRRRRA